MVADTIPEEQIMQTIKQLRSKLDQKKGQIDLLTKSITTKNEKLKNLDKKLGCSEKAKLIIQHVAQQTQKELQFYITDIVSLALAAVFPNPYRFELEFVQKNNKTAADFYFERDGERYIPGANTGYGPVDVAAFALRTSLWSLVKPRIRNTIILDEPFRFLSEDFQESATEMMRMLSQKLNLQIIMVSHEKGLIEGADKTFRTRLRKGVTLIKEV